MGRWRVIRLPAISGLSNLNRRFSWARAVGEFSGSDATERLRQSFESVQRSNARLTWAMLILATIAAIAGVIAAVPVIQAWIK
jgi:hypothetical protein